MLSRYRSVSGLALPQGFRSARTNNPVHQFEEATAFRIERLRERAGDLEGAGLDADLTEEPAAGLAAGDGVANDAGALPAATPQRSESQGHSGGHEGAAAGAGAQASAALLATCFRLWDGPLAGVAHQAGQFPGLLEGPAGEDVPQPPRELAQALASDLDLLAGLAQITQDIVYDAGGSESDFAVVPVILEPRLAAASGAATAAASAVPAPATAGPSVSATSTYVTVSGGGGTAAEAVVASAAGGTELGSGGVGAVETLEAEGAGGATECGGGGDGSGGSSGGPWWSLSEALAAPLSWAEVAASLGVAPGLAARMQPPLEFDSEDEFWSHMLNRHVAKLEHGDRVVSQLALQQAKEQHPHASTQQQHSHRKRHHHSHQEEQQQQPGPGQDQSAAGAAAEGGPAGAAAEAGLGAEAGTAAGGGAESGPGSAAAMASAEALAAAVRGLMGAIQYPVFQVMVGSEALGWNPIPLLWVGRSRRSGAVLGLMTAVVWT